MTKPPLQYHSTNRMSYALVGMHQNTSMKSQGLHPEITMHHISLVPHLLSVCTGNLGLLLKPELTLVIQLLAIM